MTPGVTVESACRSTIAAESESIWKGHVRRFLAHQAAECGLAKNTIEAYGRDLCEFAEFLTQREVSQPDDITPVVVQSHLIGLGERGLALASVARHLASMRMFLRFLYVTGSLREDLTSRLDSPARWRRL